MLLLHPLNLTLARQIIIHILDKGHYRFTSHVEKRLIEREIDHQDCLNALHTGIVESVDVEGSSWKYRVRSRELMVVVEIINDQTLRIITIWKIP